MVKILDKTIYNSISFNKPLILAVSGGKDSIALFHLVMKYKMKFKQLPEVIHFNHGLRIESQQEQEFVKKLCKSEKINCIIFKLNTEKYASENGLSIEEAARELRYKKLNEYASQKHIKGEIWTAHTASDQAETLIFRFLKGTGRLGLTGIRTQLKLPCGWIVKRPLLDITADLMKNYLAHNNIDYRTDKSNFDTKFPRNYIRHKLIKSMRKINPSIEENLSRQANIWVEEEEFLNSKSVEKLPQIDVKKEDGKIYVELNKIISYNLWIKRRLIRYFSPVELDYERTAALINLISSKNSAGYIELGSGWLARKEHQKLIFERELPEKSNFEYPLIPGEKIYIKELNKTIKAEVLNGSINFEKKKKNIVFFNAADIDMKRLKIRSKKDGDRMTLWGMKGTKKIKDLCIDLKISLSERNRLIIVAEENKILWAVSYRRSAIAPVGDKTTRMLKIELL